MRNILRNILVTLPLYENGLKELVITRNLENMMKVVLEKKMFDMLISPVEMCANIMKIINGPLNN